VIADGGLSGGTGGSLVKVGTGTLTLSGVNSYTGATTVNSGALVVDGSTASSSLTTVNAGGVLGGSGTIGNAAVAGGTLAPGSVGGSIFGPLTVQGSLSFTTASTYLIQVSPANAGRTNVSGTATLNGATVSAMFIPGSFVDRQYIILNGTGIGGTFNPAVVSNLASVQPTLTYDAHDVLLNIKVLFSTPSSGLNINQQNVANALTNFFNTNGGIPFAFAALNAAGLTIASGELPTAAQQTTFDAMNLFLGLLTDPFVAGRGASVTPSTGASQYAEEDRASAYAANGKARSTSERDAYDAIQRKAPLSQTYEPRWSVWAAGFGGSQTTDGNAALGSNAATSRIAGTAVGADYRLSPFTLAGFALAGGGTNFSLANGLGSGRSDLFQAGAFIRHTAGPAYISGALAYGWQDISTDRLVALAGIDRLHAEFNANAFSGRVEGGYRFVTAWTGIAPYAAAQFTTFDVPAYAESVLLGANTFGLAYGSKAVTDPRTELGVRLDKSYAMPDGILTLRGRLAWAHDYDPNRTLAATFQTLPGATFVVNGAAQASDSALTTASVEKKWLNGWSAAATFEGEFSGVTASYAGKGVVRYAW
jgi:autotransporter-associated beta strand protein